MIEIIGGAWAANETKTFVINGEYLEILEAQYPCDVMLMDKSGAQLSIMRSSEASFYSRPKEGFQTVQITSAQAQLIRIFIGSGDAGTRRISSTVQVVDGERTRGIAGAAYMATPFQGPPGAGLQSSVQLWNPPGSGRRLMVGQLRVASDTAQGIVVGYIAGACATDVTATRVASRLSGGAVGVAQARVQPAASLGAVPVVMNFTVQASQDQVFVPKGAPFVVLPGFGLTVQAAAFNSSLLGVFEFFEEVI
jgi:hypothetical protein